MRGAGMLLAILSSGGCGAAAGPKAPAAASPAKEPPTAAAPAAEVDTLFPERKSGWATVETETRGHIDALATRYVTFASSNKTAREVTQALLALYREAGAVALAGNGTAKAGSRFYWTTDSGDAAALIQIGERPFEEGFRALIASVEAEHIRLTPEPRYEAHGTALWDTVLVGMDANPTWLSHPLALHLYMSSPGARGRSLVIGERADDPVFSIPDLLPHLGYKVQRDKAIDSPERLNIIAAQRLTALDTLLRARGIDDAALSTAEAVLVPAGPAVFVGVDRALVAATSHESRALAFAATEALLEERALYTSIVLLVGQEKSSSGPAMRHLLPTVVAQLAEAAMGNADSFELSRVYSQSAALLAGAAGGERNGGVVLNPQRDDALPATIRRVLNRLRALGAAVQISQEDGWSWAARTVSALDLDAMLIGLPISGVGTPYQLLSTYDLFQARLACAAWFAR